MRQLRWFLYRLTSLARGGNRQRDLDAELRFHLEAEAEDRRAAGLADEDAKLAAQRSLGNLAMVREDTRAVWTWGTVDRFLQDSRYAFRVLRRDRSFTATALLTIVLLVGGATAVFSLVNSVLLRPLPYLESARIARVEAVDSRWTSLTYDEVQRLQGATSSFEAWGLFRPGYGVTLDRTSENPLDVRDMRITPGLFPLLGIEVVLGRPLVPDDELDGNPDVGVISYDLWQKRFGGTSDVIGKTFEWRQARTLTVVGVTAPGADVPAIWTTSGTPIVWNPIRVSQRSGSSMRFVTLARLKADRTMRTARRELSGLKAAGPGSRAYEVTGLLDSVVGNTRRVLWVFFAAVLAVLFIGVANLVSLQLVRNAARERELGVRAALGAGRWRLVRQLATESLLVSGVAAVLGIFVAKGVVGWIVSTLPPSFPRAEHISLDAQAWIFAVGLAVIVGLAVGILPALRVVRPGLAQRVGEGARSATLSHSRARIQRVLIAFETGAALVLLVGAGLLMNSLGRLMTQDAGMQERNLWAVRATLPLRYQAPRDSEFWTNALRLIREVPGVERAAITMNDTGPLGGGDRMFGDLKPEGWVGDGFSLSHRNVGPGYFETLGIPLIEGRPILDSDLRSGEHVAVLNKLAASTMWPGESAIGKHFGGGGFRHTVIGVIPDFKLNRLDGDVSLQMYVPHTDFGTLAGTSAILVRARPDAQALSERMKAVLLNLEKGLTFVDVSTMAQVRWQLVAVERFRTTALAVFALTATFLSLVGVFGLVAYAVTQRTREIGLRIALGSTYGGVAVLMVRQAFVPTAVGVAAGIVVALLSSQVLGTFLFEIEPTDPATFGAVISLFLGASATACLIPALRALKIDPSTALRHE
jgi:putative ABC transport system permease protein